MATTLPLDNPSRPDPNEPTDAYSLALWVEDFLTWFAKRNQPRSVQAYTATLRAWQVFLEGSRYPVRIATVEDFCGRLRTGDRPPAPSTANLDLAVLRSFYKFLTSRWVEVEHYPTYDPARGAEPLPVREATPKAISDEMWFTFWDTGLSVDDRVWLGLGFYAGLRRAEIDRLSSAHFRDEMIVGFERKGGREHSIEHRAMARMVARLPGHGPIVEQWLTDLAWMVEARQGESRLCSESEVGVSGEWMKERLRWTLLPRAGLDRLAFSPHCLRHSCATNLLRAGVTIETVAFQLDHRNVQTTRRYLQLAGHMTRLLAATKLD